MSILVQVDKFEGPLGLLLYLIRKDEMDIFDINIHQITVQYLDYIRKMRELDLELAGDFVAMAATLIQIKSQMLLPEYNDAGELVETEDPRKKLVQKLLEYQKYQEAGHKLYERPLLNRDFWARGFREDFEAEIAPGDDMIVEDNPLFSLISMYRMCVRKMNKGVHTVSSKLQSVSARILEISRILRVGQRVEFRELVLAQDDTRRGQVLITFLSLLELAKIGFVRLFQNESYGEIHIETQKDITGDVISQVENYDAANASAMADALIEKAELAAITEVEGAQLELGQVAEPLAQVEEENLDAATDEDILLEEARLVEI